MLPSLFGVVVLATLASAATPHIVPFKVRPVSNDTIQTGPSTRIYGGTVAQEGQFKYMVFALMRVGINSYTQCSASVVKDGWVILAAHCVVSPYNLAPNDVIIVGGKANLVQYIREKLNDFDAPVSNDLGVEERRVQKIYVHPNYNRETLEHDVALLRLVHPFSNKVEVIPLSLDKINEKKTCTILGWGLTRGNQNTFKLHYVSTKLVSTVKLGCLHKFSGSFICLVPDGRGICQGDSGSPLVCDGSVWGVASHLVSHSTHPECGESLEEYYTELHDNKKWITAVFNGGTLRAASDPRNLLASLAAILYITLKS